MGEPARLNTELGVSQLGFNLSAARGALSRVL